MLQWIQETWMWWFAPRALATRLYERERDWKRDRNEIDLNLDDYGERHKEMRSLLVDRDANIDSLKQDITLWEEKLREEEQRSRELQSQVDVKTIECEGMTRVNEALNSRVDAMMAINIRTKANAEDKEDFEHGHIA